MSYPILSDFHAVTARETGGIGAGILRRRSHIIDCILADALEYSGYALAAAYAHCYEAEVLVPEFDFL